ncbi:ribosomal protein S6 kinase [Sarcoptes scabiei]|nr:ribosomal protein S6 kinase [Sarcoptes scabiei]
MNDKGFMCPDNPLQITWCNRLWIPHLNQHNVLNYFADKNNPFYDHTCNNEHLRMRGLNMRELEKMKGIEFILLQAQEPILYVIRKQQRYSPTTVVPIANYYIIAGVIYQAPDLKSILESKLLTAIHNLQSAFDECFNYVRFHPSIDYTWIFDRDTISSDSSNHTDDENGQSDSIKEITQRKEMMITDASDSMRAKYRHSVDALIRDLYFKFPPLDYKQSNVQNNSNTENNLNIINQQNDSNNSSHEKPNGTIKVENEDDSYERQSSKTTTVSQSNKNFSVNKKMKLN